MNTFRPGKEWRDTDGELIQAHGGQVMYVDGKYYWYGENKNMTLSLNSPYWHNGVQCYSSDDLYNWKNEGTILKANDDINSPLCRQRIIDRPHILYNKKTKKYIMWIKLTGTPDKPKDWSTQHAGIAVSDKINGEYTLVDEFFPNGECMGDFDFIEDPETGKMYIYFSHIIGPNPSDVLCMTLSDDYMGVEEGSIAYFPYGSPPASREAPALFERDGRIYLATSGTSGYNPNATMIACADKYEGPWDVLGDMCIGDNTHSTFHSQIACIFKHPTRDLYIAMGDRWLVDLDLKKLPEIHEIYRVLQSGKPQVDTNYTWADAMKYASRNTSIATYVWLPIRFDADGRPYLIWEDEWRIEDFD